MQPSSTTDPESSYQKRKPFYKQSKCQVLKLMTPILMWTNLFSKNGTKKLTCQNTVNSISNRLNDGLEYFTDGLHKNICKISNWSKNNQNLENKEQSDFQDGSIGSRGYDEFQMGSDSITDNETFASSTSESKCDYSFD